MREFGDEEVDLVFDEIDDLHHESTLEMEDINTAKDDILSELMETQDDIDDSNEEEEDFEVDFSNIDGNIRFTKSKKSLSDIVARSGGREKRQNVKL